MAITPEQFKDGIPNDLNSRFESTDPHFPFKVTTTNDDIWTYEFGRWLLSNIGKNHEKWEWWWGWSSKYNFEFKEEEDKVKFILRWM